jgi:rod shape-determining protein MreD
MNIGFLHAVDRGARNAAPVAVTLLLMLAGMTPLRLPQFGAILPPFALMAVYYWAVHRPDLMRPMVAFGIGALQDLLSGAPMGVTPLTFMIAYWVSLTQRRLFLGTSFLLLWTGFAVVALVAGFVQWLAYSALTSSFVSANSALFQTALAIGLFPLPAWLFMRVQRAFLSA